MNDYDYLQLAFLQQHSYLNHIQMINAHILYMFNTFHALENENPRQTKARDSFLGGQNVFCEVSNKYRHK